MTHDEAMQRYEESVRRPEPEPEPEPAPHVEPSESETPVFVPTDEPGEVAEVAPRPTTDWRTGDVY